MSKGKGWGGVGEKCKIFKDRVWGLWVGEGDEEGVCFIGYIGYKVCT